MTLRDEIPDDLFDELRKELKGELLKEIEAETGIDTDEIISRSECMTEYHLWGLNIYRPIPVMENDPKSELKMMIQYWSSYGQDRTEYNPIQRKLWNILSLCNPEGNFSYNDEQGKVMGLIYQNDIIAPYHIEIPWASFAEKYFPDNLNDASSINIKIKLSLAFPYSNPNENPDKQNIETKMTDDFDTEIDEIDDEYPESERYDFNESMERLSNINLFNISNEPRNEDKRTLFERMRDAEESDFQPEEYDPPF